MVRVAELQIDRCHAALKSFARCMKERRWHKVGERGAEVSKEIELLRLNLAGSPAMDEELAEHVHYLEIQLRRVQRQLSMQMHAVSADVEMLERGIGQADAAKALLQKNSS